MKHLMKEHSGNLAAAQEHQVWHKSQCQIRMWVSPKAGGDVFLSWVVVWFQAHWELCLNSSEVEKLC